MDSTTFFRVSTGVDKLRPIVCLLTCSSAFEFPQKKREMHSRWLKSSTKWLALNTSYGPGPSSVRSVPACRTSFSMVMSAFDFLRAGAGLCSGGHPDQRRRHGNPEPVLYLIDDRIHRITRSWRVSTTKKNLS